jgi:large subunit ribosomal protein L29
MKKHEDYRQMSDEQLGLSLHETVKNLFHLRFQSATDRLETPSEMTRAKREVARLKTIMRERQLGVRGQKPMTGETHAS